MIELADHAPIRRQLNFEVVTEQPQGSFGMRQIELLCVVPTILDRARELQLVLAISHADSSRLAIGVGIGLRIAQPAEFRTGAEVPAFLSDEVHSGSVREAGLRIAVLITLFNVDARGIGQSSLLSRNQVASTNYLAVIRPLVFQRVIHIKVRS